MHILTFRILFLFMILFLGENGLSHAEKPDKRRASVFALVDNQVITEYDLDLRLRLTLLMNQIPLSEENLRRHRRDIEETMVHEAMKLSLGKHFDLMPEMDEVRGVIENMSNSNTQIKGGIQGIMKAHGIPEEVFARHVRAEISWRNYLHARFRAQIQVGEGEIEEVLKGLKEGKNYPGVSDRLAEESFSFSQIIFPFKPLMTVDEKEKIYQEARVLREGSASGIRFLSQAKIRSDVRVITKENVAGSYLPDQMKQILRQLSKGEASRVISADFGIVSFVLHEYVPKPKQYSAKHVKVALQEKKMDQVDAREMQNLIRNAHIEYKKKACEAS